MERSVIADLLLRFAPADVLDGLGLSQENVELWVDELEKWGEYHRIEVGALAGGVRNFVFGHNMSKRCMYANQKEI